MKTYFPHYFKRIGILFVFIAIILSCIGGVDDFRRGFNGISNNQVPNYSQVQDDFKPYFTKEEAQPWIYGSLFLSIAGFVLYLFSKEKIEDEFYQQLRAKCLTQALLFTWLFTGFIYIVLPAYELDGFYILQLHLIFYTILYVYNKRYAYSE
ncbi:hypothetical protein [Labilibaculum euxinus]|uniref:Lipoprotein n=1 Tax=Labilibaculum euxinus TaxID=2686357 RepID=A0A7M4D4F3_9BACT|nr:hypothetical protein [Labilibaculum euxinus]MUP37532.1 hypothetical protein [Labilibaculum euxinus]MVB06737.1 hypothetical protein [Labilibaculum euxinus]